MKYIICLCLFISACEEANISSDPSTVGHLIVNREHYCWEVNDIDTFHHRDNIIQAVSWRSRNGNYVYLTGDLIIITVYKNKWDEAYHEAHLLGNVCVNER